VLIMEDGLGFVGVDVKYLRMDGGRYVSNLLQAGEPVGSLDMRMKYLPENICPSS
jgi:hypothetical protein